MTPSVDILFTQKSKVLQYTCSTLQTFTAKLLPCYWILWLLISKIALFGCKVLVEKKNAIFNAKRAVVYTVKRCKLIVVLKVWYLLKMAWIFYNFCQLQGLLSFIVNWTGIYQQNLQINLVDKVMKSGSRKFYN